MNFLYHHQPTHPTLDVPPGIIPPCDSTEIEYLAFDEFGDLGM